MPILERFTALYPGVRLDVRLENSSTLLDMVAQHRVDVAIATLEAPDPDFACDRLLDQEVLVLVHDAHPWWGRETVGVRELVGQRFVQREAGSMTRHLFEAALARHGIEIAPHLVLGSREAVKEAVAAKIGLGIVLNRELGFDPRLHAVAIADAPARADEYLSDAEGEPSAGRGGGVRGGGAGGVWEALGLSASFEARPCRAPGGWRLV